MHEQAHNPETTPEQDPGTLLPQDPTIAGPEEIPGEPVFIESPESIRNNYAVHDNDGLLVATSRANSRKTPQEIKDDEFLESITEKQRGFGEREIELSGKPFTVVERLKSKKRGQTEGDELVNDPDDIGENDKKTNDAEASDDNEPANNPDGSEPASNANDNGKNGGKEGNPSPDDANNPTSPENRKAFSKPHYREYGRHIEKDDDGNVIDVRGPKIEQSYDAEGDVMKWSENAQAMRPDRQIIMHARNDQGGHIVRYVSGNKVYTIDMSRSSKTSTATGAKLVDVRNLGPGEELEDEVIGQDIADGFKLDSVEINTAEDFSLPSSRPREKAPEGGVYRQYFHGSYMPHYVFYDASGKVIRDAATKIPVRQYAGGAPGAKLEKTPSFLKARPALESRESVLQKMIDQHMKAAKKAEAEALKDTQKAEEKKAEALQKELDGLSLNDFAFDPFQNMEDLVARLGQQPQGPNPANTNTSNPNSPNTPPNPNTGGNEVATASGNIEQQINQVSERFADKAYVPSREEYEQMRELAGRIRIDYGDENGKRPIRYLNVDGGQLNAKATRDFLDRVSPNRWIMNHRESDVADDLRKHATLINIDRLDLEQRTRRDWLSFRQFEEEKWARNEAPSEEQLLEDYKDYLDRRIKMSEMFVPRPAANEQDGDVTEVITPDDIAMDALRSFKRSIRQDLKNRRRNAVSKVRKTVRRSKKQSANQEADS